MKRQNIISSISKWSCLIIYLMYAIQGCAVYIVWGNLINSDFITNLDSKNNNYIFYFDDWLSTLTQFIICIACFAAIPMLCLFISLSLSFFILFFVFFVCKI